MYSSVKLLLLLIPILSFAAIDFEDAVFPELAVSARALAMGNAYIAKVDDSATAFYNPAGLGTVRKVRSHFHLTNFYIETNKGLLDASSSGNSEDLGTNAFKGFSLDGTRELLLENRGTMTHNRFSATPNILMRFLTIGYLVSTQTRATIGTDTSATFEYADRFDHGPYAGLNLSIYGGVLKFGASAVLLNRKEAIGESDRNTTINLESDDYNKGTALIITAGGKLTLPITFLPTFAAKMHNTGAQSFTSSGAGAPEKIKSSIDLGFSITPQIGQTTRLHIEVNRKDFTDLHNDTAEARKWTFGMEFDFFRTLYLRLGYGDGWGSGGIGLKTKILEFDLTTYAVDTTTDEFRGEEDRRFALSVSAGF